jgi:CheY-like chemotaxis protein
MQLRPGTVLVIDDMEVNRALLGRRVERLGHRTLEAENGRQAIALLDQHEIDLVLCDLVMPEMDGYELISQMQAHPKMNQVPIVVISAKDDAEAVMRCLDLGAEDYVSKPFNPTLLRVRITNALERRYLRQALSAQGCAQGG